jgi:hypothetical protein
MRSRANAKKDLLKMHRRVIRTPHPTPTPRPSLAIHRDFCRVKYTKVTEYQLFSNIEKIAQN